MHRRVAEALEADPALAGDTSFAAGRVARHWYAAGDGARALVASVEAAREAKTALAFSESLSHFERALVLLDTRPRRRRAASGAALPAAPASRRGRPPLRQPGARRGAAAHGDRRGRPGRPDQPRLPLRTSRPLPLDGRRRAGSDGGVRAGRRAASRGRWPDPVAGRRPERVLADPDARRALRGVGALRARGDRGRRQGARRPVDRGTRTQQPGRRPRACSAGSRTASRS